VAIKVPHARLIAQPSDAEAYLTEARTVANLDHPNIVPVHDVGSTGEFPCYIVSKYIDGANLSTRIKHSPLSLLEAVEVVATVAEALHHAHKQGLVHTSKKIGAPKKAPDRAKVEMLQIRVSSAEKQAFQDAADADGKKMSEWIRDRLRRLSKQELERSGRQVPFLTVNSAE
jgi:hypothetical protein